MRVLFLLRIALPRLISLLGGTFIGSLSRIIFGRFFTHARTSSRHKAADELEFLEHALSRITSLNI
jgi:hypothetical protein